MRFLMLNWRDPENPLAGGAERVSLAYLSGLVERGHEVSWFANDFPEATQEQRINGIQFVRGGGKGTSVLKAVQWYRRQRRFDLVIDQHHGIPWFAPWWCGTNCIAYIHEVLGPIWDSFYPWPVNALGRWQERWTHWLYRAVPFWTPSESTKLALLDHGVRSVSVFPNGTDTTPLESLEPKPLSQPIRLITVCRLAPNKRVDHAIEVIRLLLQRGIQARLTIVGSGEMREALEKSAGQQQLSEHVQFTGQISEARKHEELQRAHFLIHTSQREGWGLNVIEANAMGTPAVVYPVGGLVDSTINGETGLVAKRESPDSVVESIVALLDRKKEYDRIRCSAWNRSKTFQWNSVLPAVCSWLEGKAAG